MTRRADDPRVVEIMRTLDIVLAFQAEDRERTGEHDALEGPIDTLVAHGVIGRRTFDDWPDEAIRALVLAFVTNAPNEHLAEIVPAVRHERRWNREYRRICQRDFWPKADRLRRRPSSVAVKSRRTSRGAAASSVEAKGAA